MLSVAIQLWDLHSKGGNIEDFQTTIKGLTADEISQISDLTKIYYSNSREMMAGNFGNKLRDPNITDVTQERSLEQIITRATKEQLVGRRIDVLELRANALKELNDIYISNTTRINQRELFINVLPLLDQAAREAFADHIIKLASPYVRVAGESPRYHPGALIPEKFAGDLILMKLSGATSDEIEAAFNNWGGAAGLDFKTCRLRVREAAKLGGIYLEESDFEKSLSDPSIF